MGIERAYIRQELNRTVMPTSSVQESGQQADITVETLLQHGFSSQQAEAMLTRHTDAWKRTLIRFLFAHKEALKHLPVVGGILVHRKNAMLQERLKQVNNQLEIDLSDCIGWYRDDFIVHCYQRLLGRNPDPEGMSVYTTLVCQGADNRVIAYAVAQSPEFGGRAIVTHLAEYRKTYKKFMRRMRLKRIPILGRLIQVLALPGQISLLNTRIERSELVVNATVEHLAQQSKQQLLQAQESVLSRLSDVATAQEKVLINIQHQVAGHGAILEILSKKLDSQSKIQQECSERLAEASHIAQEFTHHAQKRLSDLYSLSLSAQKQLSNLNFLSLSVQDQSDVLNSLLLSVQDQSDTLNSLTRDSGLQLNISTSLSEKLDALPSFIAGNSISSHMVVPGLAGGVTGIIMDGFLFGVPSEEWGLAMFLSHYGYFEKGSEIFFCHLLKPGMTVLDIGANLGIYALRALRAGCTVYAYEPTPRTCDILRQNIKINGFSTEERCHIIEAAVSDHCGKATFYNQLGTCGQSNSLYASDDVEQAIVVSTITLDSQMHQFEKVDVIKMDVEGAEYFALCGMKNLLQQNQNVKLILEFAPTHMRRAGVEPTALLSLLRDLGFSIFQIDEATATAQTVSDEDLLHVDSVNLYVKRGQL